jgi:hypothetical protein
VVFLSPWLNARRPKFSSDQVLSEVTIERARSVGA